MRVYLAMIIIDTQHCDKHPSQQGMSGQHRADSDTTWQRRIAVGPTLARFFVLAGTLLPMVNKIKIIHKLKHLLQYGVCRYMNLGTAA